MVSYLYLKRLEAQPIHVGPPNIRKVISLGMHVVQGQLSHYYKKTIVGLFLWVQKEFYISNVSKIYLETNVNTLHKKQ